jgi:hypothetical protein
MGLASLGPRSDGADPENRVLGDGCVRRNVGEPVSVEKLEASIAHHSDGQADGRPAAEDPADSGRQPKLINRRHGASSPQTRHCRKSGW